MKFKLITSAILAITAALSLPVHAQSASNSPGNCAIYAEMSADTVKKDARFDGQDDIAPALMKLAAAQTAKMEASMDAVYEKSKAFGWDKAKVDELLAQEQAVVRAGFFTKTMDKNKLYMDHLMALNSCAQGQPNDLGQSAADFTALLETMAASVIK